MPEGISSMRRNGVDGMSLIPRRAGFSVWRLYRCSFPKEERFPFLFLKVLALRKRSRFLAYYAGDKLAGFSFTVEGQDMVFLLYLAVSPVMQSKGFGSEILAYLKGLYKKPLTLNAEPLDAAAGNAKDRERRFVFYERNGFSDTGYVLSDSQMTYTVLSDAEVFSAAEYYDALYGLHPKGLGMPEIRRRM